MTADPLGDYLDVHEAARQLGVTPRMVNYYIKGGRLVGEPFAGKNFIRRDVFARFKANYVPRAGRGGSPAAPTG